MKKLMGVYRCKNCGKMLGDLDLDLCPNCNEKVYLNQLIEKDYKDGYDR